MALSGRRSQALQECVSAAPPGRSRCHRQADNGKEKWKRAMESFVHPSGPFAAGSGHQSVPSTPPGQTRPRRARRTALSGSVSTDGQVAE